MRRKRAGIWVNDKVNGQRCRTVQELSTYARKTCQVKKKEGWRKGAEIDRHRIMTLSLNALVYRVRMQQARLVLK